MLAGDYLRRGAAEFIGTFALIFIGAGSLAYARSLTDIALAHFDARAVLAVVLTMQTVSIATIVTAAIAERSSLRATAAMV